MCSVNGALKLIYSANTQMSLKYQAFLHSLLDFNTSRLVLSEFMERVSLIIGVCQFFLPVLKCYSLFFSINLKFRMLVFSLTRI